MPSTNTVTVFDTQTLKVAQSGEPLGQPPLGVRHIQGVIVTFSSEAPDGTPSKQCTLVTQVQCGATQDCLLPTQLVLSSDSTVLAELTELAPFHQITPAAVSGADSVATFATIGRQLVISKKGGWWVCLPDDVRIPCFHAAKYSVLVPQSSTGLLFCSPSSAKPKTWCTLPVQGLDYQSGILLCSTANSANDCRVYAQNILWPFTTAYTQHLAASIAKKVEYGHVYPYEVLGREASGFTKFIRVDSDRNNLLSVLYGDRKGTSVIDSAQYGLYIVASLDLSKSTFEKINMLVISPQTSDYDGGVTETILKGVIAVRESCSDLMRSVRPVMTPTSWSPPHCGNPGPCASIADHLR
jgi:hypothetical protein